MTIAPAHSNPRLALIALAAAYFFVGASSLAVIGLVPEMSAGLSVSPSLIATLVTVFAIVYALAAPGLQTVAGGVQRRGLVVAGLGLMAAACFGSALAPDYATLLVMRLIGALGAALVGPTVSATAAALVPPEGRARALSAVFAGMTVSIVVGIPLASFLGQTVGWRWSWAVVGLGALAVAPLVWASVPADNRGSRATLGTLVTLLRDRPIALTVATTAVQIGGQFVLYTLLAAWMVESLGAAPSLVPLALMLFGIGGVAGNAMSSLVTARIGAERTVQAAITLMAAVLLVLGTVPLAPEMGIAFSTLWAFFALAIMAPMQSRLVRLAPERSNLTLALNASAIYVGNAFGAALCGLIYAGFGPDLLPLGALIVVLAALAVFRASMAGERA